MTKSPLTVYDNGEIEIDPFYWQEKESWYYIDDSGNYHLSDKATKLAKASFEVWEALDYF